MPVEGDPALRPRQAEAFLVVKRGLSSVFPDALLVEPIVNWWDKPCPSAKARTETAVVIGDRCYAGLGYRDGAVEVAWRGSFGQSAYTHELMHHYLKLSGKDPDPGHNQTAFWELVSKIDTMLQSMNL